MKNILLFLLLSSTFSNAQLGEFGSLDLRLGGNGGATRVQQEGVLANTGRTFELRHDDIEPWLEARYVRFFPTSLSTYISGGLGYSRNITEVRLITRQSGEGVQSRFSFRREHFALIPIKFHKIFAFEGKSNQRDDKLETSYKRLGLGGVRFGLGANVYYSFLGPKIRRIFEDGSDSEVNEQVVVLFDNISDNVTRLIFGPEFTVDLLFNDEFSIGFGVNYSLQSRINDNILSFTDLNEEGMNEFVFDDSPFLNRGIFNLFLTVKISGD